MSIMKCLDMRKAHSWSKAHVKNKESTVLHTISNGKIKNSHKLKQEKRYCEEIIWNLEKMKTDFTGS